MKREDETKANKTRESENEQAPCDQVDEKVRSDYSTALFYLQDNRRVGHTKALIDAAVRNRDLVIVADQVSLNYINDNIGRIHAITMSELKNVSNKPIVFDNSLITNLLMKICPNDNYIPKEWR